MAAAQGFFAMGAGNSRYAMQNMAEGLGISTKQLQAAEKEYRVGEKARLEGIGVLKQAQRAEVLGNQKEAANSYEKYEGLMEKQQESKRKTAEHLLTTATQQEQILATQELRVQQARDAAAERAQQARAAAAGRQSVATMYEQGRTDRARELANTKRADSYLRAVRGDAAYKGLQEKESEIANLGPREAMKPEKQRDYDKAVATRDALQAQISKRARAIAIRETQEDMGLQAAADSIMRGDKK
jgi:hypothetical protein